MYPGILALYREFEVMLGRAAPSEEAGRISA
jgi:hypothetical protein